MTKKPADEFRSAWEGSAERQQQLSPAEKQFRKSQLDKCARVLDRVRDELEKYPNVVGTGISMKFKNGEVLDQPCIVVRVTKKIPNLKDGAVPAKIDGWPTDVIETGIPELTAAFPEPGCPLRPGNSIAHARHTGSGTLGCLVKDVSPLGTIRSYLDKSPFSDILFLSCNHVIAMRNRARSGDRIVHPAPTSEPKSLYSANLERWIDIKKRPDKNEVDAAVAKPIVPVDPTIFGVGGIGIPKGIRDPLVNDRVMIAGKTSGVSLGTVNEIHATVNDVGYGPPLGVCDFTNCIATTLMTHPGDSGSLLVDLNNSDPNNTNGLGLTFCQDPDPNPLKSYFNDLRSVLRLLDVELVTSANWPSP